MVSINNFKIKIKKLVNKYRAWLNSYEVGGPAVIGLWMVFIGAIFYQSGFISGVDRAATIGWVQTEFQAVVTLFALVMSIAFLAMQIASQAYSYRISQKFLSSKSLWINLFLGVIVLTVLLLIEASLTESQSSSKDKLIFLKWLSLSIGLLFLFYIPIMLVGLWKSFSPKNIIEPIVLRFDKKFIHRQVTAMYGHRNYVPIPPEDNPIYEMETLLTHLYDRHDFDLANTAFHYFLSHIRMEIKKVKKEESARKVESFLYEPFSFRLKSFLFSIGKQLVRLRDPHAWREFLIQIYQTHKFLFENEYSMDFSYQQDSFPKIVLMLGKEAVDNSWPEGLEEVSYCLGWMFDSDLTHLVPDREQNEFNWEERHDKKARRDINGGEGFGNLDNLYISSPANLFRVMTEKIKTNQGKFFHYYSSIIIEVLHKKDSETHGEIQKRIISGIIYQLRGIIDASLVSKNFEGFSFFNFGFIQSDLLRVKHFKTSNHLTKFVCDVLLRIAQNNAPIWTIRGNMVNTTMHGLHALNHYNDAKDELETVVKTLKQLTPILKENYSSIGLGSDYDSIYEELGQRFIQIRDSNKDALRQLDSSLVMDINDHVGKFWPDGVKEKHVK